MATLSEHAKAIRSKNAGPFWVTVDLFFDNESTFDAVSESLETQQVAEALQLQAATLKRFDLRDISVIKFSFPRHVVQGNRLDRDIHGAQYAWLLADITLPTLR